jgi:hypothetical protein
MEYDDERWISRVLKSRSRYGHIRRVTGSIRGFLFAPAVRVIAAVWPLPGGAANSARHGCASGAGEHPAQFSSEKDLRPRRPNTRPIQVSRSGEALTQRKTVNFLVGTLTYLRLLCGSRWGLNGSGNATSMGDLVAHNFRVHCHPCGESPPPPPASF